MGVNKWKKYAGKIKALCLYFVLIYVIFLIHFKLTNVRASQFYLWKKSVYLEEILL